MESRDFLDLTTHRVSQGITTGLTLGDRTLEYLSIKLTRGRHTDFEANPLQSDPLMIRPSEISRAAIEAPAGLTGDFVRYAFHLQVKNTNSPLNVPYIASEEVGVENFIRLEDIEDFEDYIFGDDRKIII